MEPRERPTAVLTFDLEDWHQLVHRRLGIESWDVPHQTFERQAFAILDLLDEIEAKATCFVLGLSAKNYPELVRAIAQRGHEIACHGFAHERVFAQAPERFQEDVRASVELLGELTGKAPSGYRAPAFSINRDAIWAYEILAELGFRYDSSQYDSPRVSRRMRAIPPAPFRLALPSGSELWELPIAVWRTSVCALPIGGGGYWRFFPESVLARALREMATARSYPVLYFHPYECDPSPLRANIPPSAPAGVRLKAALRTAYRNVGRGRTPPQVRRVARELRLVTCEQLLEDGALSDTRTRALSQQGVFV